MDLKKKLTTEAFRITQESATETPFSGKYYQHNEHGNYHCICCDKVLFSSADKFDSGTGWPSFSAVLAKDNVKLINDNSHFMDRVEVRCANCNAHLGHIFADGPKPTGQRYCINSVSLDFKTS